MMMLFPFHSCFIQYRTRYIIIYRQHTVLYRMIQYYVCMIYHQYLPVNILPYSALSLITYIINIMI